MIVLIKLIIRIRAKILNKMQNEQNAAFVSSHKQLQNHGSVLTKTEKKQHKELQFTAFEQAVFLTNTDFLRFKHFPWLATLTFTQTEQHAVVRFCSFPRLYRCAIDAYYEGSFSVEISVQGQRFPNPCFHSDKSISTSQNTHTHTDTNSHKPQKTIALRTSANWFQ